MATLKTGTTIGGNVAWHAGNDGSGTGLDADTVDGVHGSGFMPSQVATAAPAVRRVGDIYVDSDSGYYAPWDYAWQYPPLLNGWVNYGYEWGPARYRKTMSGIVIIEGLVAGGANGTDVFTLPAGFAYRPNWNLLFPSIDNPNKSARITVYSTGEVRYSAINGNSGFFSLCCYFYGYK